MLVLNWQKPDHGLELAWQGPTKVTRAIPSIEAAQQKFAVISGPRGAKGDKGDPGEVGGIPTSLDGGFF